MRRPLLALVVAAALAPGLWWRSPPPVSDTRQQLTMTELPTERRAFGDLRLVGAWALTSPNEHFHGYSALVAMDDGTLLAGSDRGRMLLFAPPGRPARDPVFDHFAGREVAAKRFADLEALTRDPATGRIWAAYEVTNRIARFEPGWRGVKEIAPAAMATWPENGGPEALVRLADGRFIAVSEGDPALFADGAPGLLFPSDPVDGAAPVTFRFRPPEGFSAVDMAQLPDGRVMILLRGWEWALSPRFLGKVMIADPAEIAEGDEWTGEVIAELAPPLPMDNYEGLAIEPAGDDAATIWLISDDNAMRFQRTLLLRFTWSGNEKARGSHRAPQ